MSTAFDYDLGVSQGRIQPQNAQVLQGLFLECLGSDRLPAPVFNLAVGDRVELAQTVDLTAVDVIRAIWRVRQPLVVPRKLVLPAGTTLVHGGVVAASARHARRTAPIAGGAGAVVYWAKSTGTPSPGIRVAHVNPGPSNTLAVDPVGRDITVRLGTDGGGVATSTTAQVAAAVNANLEASALVTAAPDNDGTSIAGTQALVALVIVSEDVDAVVTLAAFFTQEMAGRVVRISGSGAGNNGDKIIAGVVPEATGAAYPSKTALLGTAIATEAAGFAAFLVGARWRAELEVDGGVRAQITERLGRDKVRFDLGAHVSKMVGPKDVRFRLKLVEVD